MLLVCALASEERAARSGGAAVIRVGLGADRPLPGGPLVSFGLAGALVSGLEAGALVTAARIVDEHGTVLWEGTPLAVPGARPVVFLASDRIVDDPAERRALAAAARAEAVDLESGRLAASGRLHGVLRAISDTPARPLGRLASAATPEGGVAWPAVARAFGLGPLSAARTARDARKGLRSLAAAARALSA